MLQDREGRKVRYGLAKGSADLIGMQRRLSEANGVIAQFVSIEVKRPGKKPTEEQLAWGRMVQQMGGLHILATSVADVEAALQ